ncbi:MAG: hypothetical protein VX722_01540 [Pseudomonadota bacterium]|nr:hypothetical protein [Pseudomonadota bacterium]
MNEYDTKSPENISYLISYSVRWAVPFIYIVMMASSLRILFPGSFSAWLVRNRKYIGLIFALGMAWQALFIFMLSNYHRDYYYNEVFYFRDEIEGSIGYIFLTLMVATSFKKIASKINSYQWKLIQKSGLYFLWAYAFSVYWWNLFYYPFQQGGVSPRLVDYIFYWVGFIAFAVRIAAWSKSKIKSVQFRQSLALRCVGYTFVLLGIFMAGTGNLWLGAVNKITYYFAFSEETSLWLPFWPLEPFLSLILIASGAYLLTSNKFSLLDRASALQVK